MPFWWLPVSHHPPDPVNVSAMDPLTQGALGAIFSLSFTKAPHMKRYAAAGALGGMAPDLDVLIRSSTDPLLALEYHRHFTHSLIFIPIGGALVGAALWLLDRKRLPLSAWLIPAVLGWATHALLDACTSYGTQLFWPLSNERIAWSNVAVVDPIPTLFWLLGAVVATRIGKPLWARAGLVLGIGYLLLGVQQRSRAMDAAEALVRRRGHVAERIDVKPTLLNNTLWRSTYRYDGHYYADGIYVGFGASPRVYEGDRAPAFTLEQLSQAPAPGSVLGRDIERFTWFSDGWVAMHPDMPNVIGDVRYALLPSEIRPIWGIIVDVTRPDAHAPFEEFRGTLRPRIATYWAMMRGQDTDVAGGR